MRVRRSRRCLAVSFAACFWSTLIVVGCSSDEAPPNGVSPFDPKPLTAAKPSLPDGIDLPGASASGSTAAKDPLAGVALPGSKAIDTTFGANEVEKTLRVAMRLARNKETAKAGELLDQVLVVEPLNREALLARGALAMEEWRKGKSTAEQTVAIEKAVKLARSLRRAYEQLKGAENDFFGAVLYGYAQHLGQLKKYDDAIKALGESSDVGFDAYFIVEVDEKMAEFRKSPEFQAALKAHDAARLALARERVGAQLKNPVGIKFAFTLSDLDKKQVSLTDFRGKVVLVDFWGTWCGPCRQTIPGLIALYKNRKSKGLEILGIDYEKEIPDPAAARDLLKRFTKDAGMTYPCLLGDEATLRQIPDFKGFPTTVIVDRAGRVRALILENDTKTPELIRDVVEVLLEEPPPSAEPAPKAAAEPQKKPS